MRSIAIIMTHFNRDALTKKSISSILDQKYDGDYVIIVVDDSSDITFEYKHDKVVVIRTKKRKWCSPVIAYNYGIHEALKHNPDIIIIQNSEAFHVGNVLNYISENLNDANYLSMGCIASDRKNTQEDTLHKIVINYDNIQCVQNDADDNSVGWYNHSVIYPRAFDFCSAITTSNMKRLNGFDERFDIHVWYGDDNFRNRVRLLGLKTEIIDYPYVIHQWHSREHQPYGYTDKSFKLYQETILENNFKAKHKITEDFK
jgi:GT2 family glycosyltransferase